MLLEIAIVAFRLACACLTRSYIDPDEFWQSLEPARYLADGSGELTWEWKSRIRSWIYPLVLAFFTRLFGSLWAARVVGTAVASTIDIFTIKSGAALGLHKDIITRVTLSSWLLAVYGVKAYSNSIECALFVLAFYLGYCSRRVYLSTGILGLAVLIRPTILTHSAPLFLFYLHKHRLEYVIKSIMTAIAVIAFGAVVDSIAYGQFTFSWWNFFSANYLSNVSAHYGVNPWHYHMTCSLPTICGLLLPVTLLGIIPTGLEMPKALLAFSVFANSLVQHKEIRFMMPMLPMLNILAARGLGRFRRHAKYFLVANFATCCVLFYIFGIRYQSGSVEAAKRLHEMSGSVLAFMPCHSLPNQCIIQNQKVKLVGLSCLPFDKDALDDSILQRSVDALPGSYDHILVYENHFDSHSDLFKEFSRVKTIPNWSFDDRRNSAILLLSRNK